MVSTQPQYSYRKKSYEKECSMGNKKATTVGKLILSERKPTAFESIYTCIHRRFLFFLLVPGVISNVCGCGDIKAFSVPIGLWFSIYVLSYSYADYFRTIPLSSAEFLQLRNGEKTGEREREKTGKNGKSDARGEPREGRVFPSSFLVSPAGFKSSLPSLHLLNFFSGL